MSLPADTARCNGALNPINHRPLLICQDCERRLCPGNDWSPHMGPPAKHDGKQWVCDGRSTRENNRS